MITVSDALEEYPHLFIAKIVKIRHAIMPTTIHIVYMSIDRPKMLNTSLGYIIFFQFYQTINNVTSAKKTTNYS